MPETKGLSLEELDQVFSVPTRVHAKWGGRQIPYFFKRYILRQDVQKEELYHREDETVHSYGEEREHVADKRV